MSYATGSGDYNAMIAALVAFLVADGWTESGGVGTGFPMVSPSGEVRGVDIDSFTRSETDFTNGAGVPITHRIIRVAVGSSPANATSNLSTADAAHVYNMHYNIDKWQFFSDLTVSEHVNVSLQFSNGIDAKVFTHFSFGVLDRHGMTYDGMAYATSHPVRGFSPDTLSDENLGNDAHSGIYARIRRFGTGRLGYQYTTYSTDSNFCYMTEPGNHPFPNLPTWPQPDILNGQERLMDTYGPSSGSFEVDTNDPRGLNPKFSHSALFAESQPYSGGVSLMPIPVWIANTTSNITSLQYINVGSIPNIRVCSLANLLEDQEISYAAENWVVLPLLCRKPRNTLGQQYTVTSGLHGLAYKKVL